MATRLWLEAQLAEKRTEPNSGLGKAITYLLMASIDNVLRVAGAPFDNNIVERALKRAVLHRKNALFYRTLNGAKAGDLFMSLIHTCQLCGANSFDYLTELQRHARTYGQPRGVDAVELRRDACAGSSMMKCRVAGKDRFRLVKKRIQKSVQSSAVFRTAGPEFLVRRRLRTKYLRYARVSTTKRRCRCRWKSSPLIVAMQHR